MEAVVSYAYTWPTTGTKPPSRLPAPSWIVPLAVRFRPIEPLFVPVVPTVTVQEAAGVPPTETAEAITGALPLIPLRTRPKFPVPTFETGSLNVTVQCSGPAFAGLASVRLIDETVGAVLSIVTAFGPEEP